MNLCNVIYFLLSLTHRKKIFPGCSFEIEAHFEVRGVRVTETENRTGRGTASLMVEMQFQCEFSACAGSRRSARLPATRLPVGGGGVDDDADDVNGASFPRGRSRRLVVLFG